MGIEVTPFETHADDIAVLQFGEQVHGAVLPGGHAKGSATGGGRSIF